SMALGRRDRTLGSTRHFSMLSSPLNARCERTPHDRRTWRRPPDIQRTLLTRSTTHRRDLRRGAQQTPASPEPPQQNPWQGFGPYACGGAKGIRTPDLFHAMEARYQLRHSPVDDVQLRRSEEQMRNRKSGCTDVVLSEPPLGVSLVGLEDRPVAVA